MSGRGTQDDEDGRHRSLADVVERFALATSTMIENDPELLALFPDRRAAAGHTRSMGQHLHAVLAGTGDPARATQIGHSHVEAGLRPSTYLMAYNQVFPCIHAVPAPELPPLPAMRSRWLDDACATLDSYHQALLTAWTRERAVFRSAVAKLGQEATTDELTGVLNRRGFIGAIQASRRAGCLVLMDLDRFKAFNDRAGHPAGDAVLRTVGRTLTAMSRPGDAAGRLGGDEFAVWLEGGSPTAAHSVLQRVRAALPADVGVSGGTADGTSGRHDFAQLHAVADAALYGQKGARLDIDGPASREP